MHGMSESLDLILRQSNDPDYAKEKAHEKEKLISEIKVKAMMDIQRKKQGKKVGEKVSLPLYKIDKG
jgi:hypothetical protein